MDNVQERQNETLSGTVEHIVFCNEDNGWTVLELDTGDTVETVVGVLPLVNAGESLKLQGQWTEHPNFGRQFKATACESRLPTDSLSILRYLSSGAVRGIGPSTAARIVDRFGADSLRILEETPEELAKIKGISLSKAREMGASYAAQFGLREVILAFAGFGLTPNEALRAWKRFGPMALSRIKENPYLLCLPGLRIGFERADAICMAIHGDKNDPNRLEAGVAYVLRHNLNNGHTCLPRDKVQEAAARLLEVPLDTIDSTVTRMVEGIDLYQQIVDGRSFLFLPRLYEAERYIAMRMMNMHSHSVITPEDVELRITAMERNFSITYEEEQRQAMLQALSCGSLILTGGPGTGKTTTLRGIITLLESAGETVSIAAPTGRAAKRISQLTGRNAKTLHRLLEVKWDDSDSPVFDRNEKNQLEADTVVVDEMSMVDTLLFESLLRALKSDCRLILVGDMDQLPAVGPGSILQDLIQSGDVPVVSLQRVFRQAMESRIVCSAHRIIHGDMPALDNAAEGDCFFMPRQSQKGVTETVLELCQRRLPSAYGYTAMNGLQVLCAGRKGELGTEGLNLRLQELLNPPDKKKPELKVEGSLLRQGDKVMHNRNNYDIPWENDEGECGSGIFNGDIGVLEEVLPREECFKVRYDDRVALYTKQDAQDLELAYAITVHKSQGSEFDAVVLPIFHNNPKLCYRNLLYTAVTRARKLLVMVGSPDTLKGMVDNNRKALRYTGLLHFLKMCEEDK